MKRLKKQASARFDLLNTAKGKVLKMDEIIAKATALGEAIRDSEAMKNYTLKEIAYENSEEAQILTAEYSELRTSLAEEAKREDITPMEMIEIRKKMAAKYEELLKCPAIGDYMAAKQDIEDILAKVDSIIKYFVTGEKEQEGSCSGNCGSCGGCH